MSTRTITGIVLATVGVLLSMTHIVLALLSSVPERDHRHEAIIATGFVLAIVGILLLGDTKKRD